MKRLLLIGGVILMFIGAIVLIRTMVRNGKIKNEGLIKLFGTEEQKKALANGGGTASAIGSVDTVIDGRTGTTTNQVTEIISHPDYVATGPSILSTEGTVISLSGEPVLSSEPVNLLRTPTAMTMV